MRKISHWRLAKHLAEKNGKVFFRFLFKVGSIMPDFLYHTYLRGHTYEGTIDLFTKNISKLEDKGTWNGRTGYRLGYTIHFLEDYFTLPHNENFLGNMKDHCSYEKHQQAEFLRRLKMGEVEEEFRMYLQYSREDFVIILAGLHEEYLKETPAIETDCRYIFTATELLRDRLFARFEQNATVQVA